MNSLRKFLLSLLCISLSSCGGGGGGGDSFAGAAFVDIDASPYTIDAGDRMKITTFVSNVHENGIALKFRYSSKLSYVPTSARIEDSNGNFLDLTPTNNATATDSSYLVFYINADDFGENQQGHVEFELVGLAANEDTEVEVDADVDDPAVSNATEFNVETPLFDPEDSIGVSIKG